MASTMLGSLSGSRVLGTAPRPTPKKAPAQEDAPLPSRKLKPEDVEYIAMEGGGGKGFAYVGAVQVLEKLNVLEHVKGFAGASAGAIMSMLLSIGYGSEDLMRFMAEKDFTKFFDVPVPVRTFPRVLPGKYARRDPTAEELKVAAAIMILEQAPWTLVPLAAAAGMALGPIGSEAARRKANAMRKALAKKVDEIRKKGPPFDVLVDNLPFYLAYIERDMGLFGGEAARDLFATTLSEAAADRGEEQDGPMTFDDHHRIFGKTLLVSGTNLSNGTTQLFSWRDTPSFPVADAIRISMSLPFIFKPYVITEQDGFAGKPACGTYVDGGVWNNLPFREFDYEPPAKGSDAMPSMKPRTLALRLEIAPAVPVTDFKQFLGRYAQFGLTGSGETQVTSRYVDQTITLDTTGLDLLKFTPPSDDAPIKRARRAVYRYFGMDVPNADEDEKDDAHTQQLQEAADLCHPKAPRSPLYPFLWVGSRAPSDRTVPGPDSADDTGHHGSEIFLPVNR